jgi:hypothetical protein
MFDLGYFNAPFIELDIDSEVRKTSFVCCREGRLPPQRTLKRVRELLKPGTLIQKYEDITLFLGSGHSMLYSGDVSWKVSLPGNEVKGNAESVDHALTDISRLFVKLLQENKPDTKVRLDVRSKEVS